MPPIVQVLCEARVFFLAFVRRVLGLKLVCLLHGWSQVEDYPDPAESQILHLYNSCDEREKYCKIARAVSTPDNSSSNLPELLWNIDVKSNWASSHPQEKPSLLAYTAWQSVVQALRQVEVDPFVLNCSPRTHAVLRRMLKTQAWKPRSFVHRKFYQPIHISGFKFAFHLLFEGWSSNLGYKSDNWPTMRGRPLTVNFFNRSRQEFVYSVEETAKRKE
jgi:hypothetical protein